MTTQDKPQAERAAFEAWAIRDALDAGYGFTGWVTEKNFSGAYSSVRINGAWDGWQARASHPVNAQLLEAAKGLTKFYSAIWDRADGCIVLMPDNVEAFEAAHAKLVDAIAAHHGSEG